MEAAGICFATSYTLGTCITVSISTTAGLDLRLVLSQMRGGQRANEVGLPRMWPTPATVVRISRKLERT
jgi:hypothetical protein